MKNQLSPEFVLLLEQYIGLQSVSTDPAFKPHMDATVDWLSKLFKDNSFEVKIFRGPETNPVVFAEHHVSDELPTKMIYGHYDVQPAVQDGWLDDPFKLRKKDGYLIGRGVVDNKGQNLIHIFTVIQLIKEGKLGCNVKFLIEGNEETGNEDLGNLVKQYAEELKCDQIIISDGELAGNLPVIEESLRGGGNLTLIYSGTKTDLHSGLYGSGVPSATKELIALLAKMLSTDGTVNIPGFYDAVDEVTPAQIERNLAQLKISDPVKEGVVKAMIGKYDFNTMTGIWPAVEVSGFNAGYTGEGYQNIIPAKAFVKINFRLVASQTPQAFVEMFKKYIEENTPKYIDYEVFIDKLCFPVKVRVDSPEILKIMEIQEKVYGIKPGIKNVGGGIPVVDDFKKILGIDAALVSLGNGDCNMHGAEERFNIDLIKKGLQLSHLIFGME